MSSRTMAFVSTLILLATLLPMFALVMPEEGEAQSALEPMMLNPIKVYLSEGMSMTPLPPESADEFQAISIPNGFIKDGLFGFNLLPIGHTYWRAVGEWRSEPLRETINLGGKIDISVFATREEGSGSVSSDFIFELLRGSEPLIQLSVMSQRINDGVDTKITGTGWFPSNNDTTVEAGTTISLRIQARCNGGAIMKYGSSDVDSGVEFSSNSLSIQNVFIDKEKVTVEYKDAFMVPWIKLYTELKVNQIIQPNVQMQSQMNTINRTREIIWERETPAGTYQLDASMSYSPIGERNVSYQATVKVIEPEVSWGKRVRTLISDWLWLLILIVIGIVALSFLSKRRKRTWKRRFKDLPPTADSLSVKQRKKAWKRANKQKRRTERDKRKVEKEVEKEAEEEEGFSLFKKKGDRSAKARRTPRVTAVALSIDSSDELEL
ncbi:MAG: hypothetical protein ACMUHB_02695 [Thermoplasmatota archaeon]